MKSSAILRPNYFRYVWKSSAIQRSIYQNYVEIFRNLPFCLPRYTLKSFAILRSTPKPMALNLLLTFSVQYTKAVLQSSVGLACHDQNYFRYVWKSSAILRSIYLNYVEIFRNLPFCLPRYTLKSFAILRSTPKPMALNLLLTFSVQYTKAVLQSSV